MKFIQLSTFIYADVDCWSKPESGGCKVHNPRYFYDNIDNTCKIFYHGGCEENDNIYLTEKKCLEACFSEGKSK